MANHKCQVSKYNFPKATKVNPYPEATNVTVDDAYYKAAQFLPQSMSILSFSRHGLFPSHLATYLDWYRYFGNFWCESQTKQHAGSTSRNHSHYKRVFVPIYHFCRHPARGYRGWQRSWSLLNERRKTPDIHSATICLRVGPDLVVDYECSLPTRCRFSRWNQFAGMIALTQQSVKFWGASFAYSTVSTSGFSPQAIFKEGITSSLPGSLISTFVCFLTQTHCAFNADRFVCDIEFHSTTIVATFAQGKKELCKNWWTKRISEAIWRVSHRILRLLFRGDLLTCLARQTVMHAMLVNAKDMIWYAHHDIRVVGSPWYQQYGRSSRVGVGLSPVRVCDILWPFLRSLLISSRSQLNISRVFFHDGIGFKYNLVCA